MENNPWHMDLARGILGNAWNDAPEPMGPQDFVQQLEDPQPSTSRHQQHGGGAAWLPPTPAARPAHRPPHRPSLRAGQSQHQQLQQDPQTPSLPPMEAEYESWLKAQGITGQTVDSMRRHGICSRRVLAGLQPEDPADMGISNLGQRRLLQLLARECSSHQSQGGPGVGAQPAPTINQPQSQAQGQVTPPPAPRGTQAAGQVSDPLACLSDQLAALFNNPTSMAGPAATQGLPHQTGERVDLNALIYLLPNQRPKYKDIVDYVEESEPVEEIVGQAEGTQVIVRSGARRIKLEQVSPMQWSAANLRIMIDLLREGQLQPHSILDYVAYTIKVSSLATPYTWPSVLQWDRAYRRLQQQMGYRWGSDSPHLASLYLVARQPLPGKKGKGGQVAHGGRSVKPICRGFNKGNCTYKEDCQFRHVCSVPQCGRPHPATQHEVPKNP